jgi:hypothetical protein
MGSAVLADPQGQTELPVAGVRLGEAFNTAFDLETTSLWPEPFDEGLRKYRVALPTQELARRAAVAEPGGQTSGVTVHSEALRRPQVKLQPDNQDASASGSSEEKMLTEVSAGGRT